MATIAQRVAEVLPRLTRRLPGALALSLFVGVVLLQTGLVSSEQLTPLFIAVFCGLFIMVAEIRSKLDRFERNINLYLKTPNELHTLGNCQNDLKDELKQVKHNSQVMIHHLGLDMATAWQKLDLLIESTAKSKASGLNINLLMFTDDISEVCIRKPPPAELGFIAEKSKGQLQKIRHDVEKLKMAFSKMNKYFSFEIRLYAEVPVVHGFALKEPQQKHYLSFGRWAGSDEDPAQASDWDWGGTKYRMISAPPSDAVLADEALIFDEFFNYLWKHASRKVFYSASLQTEGK